jgi:hypothetical protein
VTIIATIVPVMAIVTGAVIAAMVVVAGAMVVAVDDLPRHLPRQHVARDFSCERRGTDEQRGNESKSHWAFHRSSPERIGFDPLRRQYRGRQLSGG